MRRVGAVMLVLAACSSTTRVDPADAAMLSGATSIEVAAEGSDDWLTVTNAAEVDTVVQSLGGSADVRTEAVSGCEPYEVRFYRPDGSTALITSCGEWLSSAHWDDYVRAPAAFRSQIDAWVALLP